MAGGFRSPVGRWVGGLSAPSVAAGVGGYRSVFFRWLGGLSAPSGVVPPVVVAPSLSPGGWGEVDVGKLERRERELDEAWKDDRAKLRRSIERAIRKANGEDVDRVEASDDVERVDAAPLEIAADQQKPVVRAIRADLRDQGIDLSLRKIKRLLIEFEQSVAAFQAAENQRAASIRAEQVRLEQAIRHELAMRDAEDEMIAILLLVA